MDTRQAGSRQIVQSLCITWQGLALCGRGEEAGSVGRFGYPVQ